MAQLTVLLILLLASRAVTSGRARALVDSSSASSLARRRALPFEESPEAPERLPRQRAGYLYPVLSWGPNNQVAGLKEVLTLGRLLNRTVIVHDILNHYDEQQAAGAVEGQELAPQSLSMPFELVFNLDHISRHQSVVTQSELQGGGWDGVLQAVAYFDDEFLPQVKNALTLNVTDSGAAYLEFPAFNCSGGELAEMARALAPYKYVGVIVYEHVVQGAGHGLKLYPNGNLCHDTFLQVTAQLTKSDKIVQMAAAFREQRLGGEGYMAVHIRPYPDKCLYVWRHPNRTDDDDLRKMCKNPRLIKVFAGQTRHAMKDHHLQSLFVMSYPSIRDRITELFDGAGLKPVFYDETDMEAAMGYKSVSLLGMVEEEIALEADVFIGTSYSSMTGVIIAERYCRGIWAGLSTCFTRTTW